MARYRQIASAVAAFLFVATAVDACAPVDFHALPLPSDPEHPVAASLELAFPGAVTVSPQTGSWSVEGGPWHPLGTPDTGPRSESVLQAELIDQFRIPYPLEFDMAARSEAWFDPGRARSATFFSELWFSDEAAARASLTTVAEPALSDVRYRVTRRHGVDCQLSAVLRDLAGIPGMAPFFQDPGGSFNWRRIAGTDRLSAHSYGIAVDINAALGGYWRWSGRPEGNAGEYETRIPEELVRAFERRGFIWGGKWHHFDGMHFEYRPELILHSRLISSPE
ncbi:M15 family metallopeptidase [Palleronia abyssalis]|uniref:Peptidase M15C domain-containing protein n=1 Tax=Palleronia abyssalis TaxID=1501240 RepID=A0A2R8BZA1_9RHOB|nr:M15 family metallopeptidase [Palleronia abyssalis]SPJ25474.1 hypothetical protein PAA8504_03325 [Palleronia abyssalis]